MSSLHKLNVSLLICKVFGLLAVVSLPNVTSAQDNVVRSLSDARLGAVHITIEEEYPPGTFSRRPSGSGVLVSPQGYVLTAKHILRKVNQDGRLIIRGAIGSKDATLRRLHIIVGLAISDLQLLVFQDTFANYPYVFIGDPEPKPKIGTPLWIFGFPANDLPYVQSSGKIVGPGSIPPAWNTDLSAAHGMSGSPVFNEYGHLLAILIGGYPPYALTEVLPIDFMRRHLASAGAVHPPGGDSRIVEPKPQESIQRRYAVSETKDDHPRTFDSHSREYTRRFEAEEGYVFVDADFERESATRASDITLNILESGRVLEIRFRLTSGPAVDRWRGWLRGTVVAQLQRRQ